MKTPVHRRVLPWVATVLGLGLIAAACSTSAAEPRASSSRAPSPSPSVITTGSPDAFDAAALETATPIKHVVFLIKENRTFDNLFGTFPGANGVSTGMAFGQPRTLTRGTDGRLPGDLPHCYNDAIRSWNRGAMDGFLQGGYGAWAYTQLHEDQLPNYWHWARHNVLFDNFFACAQGPSFPNHLFTIAATSGGTHDNPRRVPSFTHGSNTFGCDAPPLQTVEVYDSEGRMEKVPPCFDFQTEGDLLNRARIPWAYYAASEDQKGYIWSAYSAIGRYRMHPERWQKHMFPVDEVVDDIREGLLPPVTWITPRFELSEHPEFNFCHGENWTTKVIDAIMRSPMWEDDRDLPHVGRLRRLLRPRAAAAGRRLRVRVPRPAAGAQPVREAGQGEWRARRVLERAPVHRGQLGADAADQARPARHADALGVRLRAGAAGARPAAAAR